MGERSITDLCDLHNEQAPKIVADIVRPTITEGGTAGEVLVLLESVIAGTLATLATLELMEGRNADRGIVLAVLLEGARERWAEIIDQRRKGAH